MENLKQGLASENWTVLTEAAHKMASPCRHLGAIHLYNNLKEIEKMENGERNINRAKELIESVEMQISGIALKIKEKIA